MTFLVEKSVLRSLANNCVEIHPTDDVPDVVVALQKSTISLAGEKPSLLSVKAGERALCFRLAYHLARQTKRGFVVDVEYDKRTIRGKTTSKEWFYEDEIRGFIPDIIVHRRKEETNLLAIEAKWVSRITTESLKKDIAKLAHLRDCYKYESACFVLFNVPKIRIFTPKLPCDCESAKL